MTASGNMPPPDTHDGSELLQLALPVSQKVVLVIDLVESVRLMAADEAGTVARWRDFAQTAQNHTIPAHHGRLVKSLGDGLMVEFETPRDAANAAHTLHAVMQKGNAVQSPERHMHLRAGINATHVYTDHNDIYGAGVNLAARIATLAGPGETVVTAPVRDGLTDGLDATIEDLGECYLKHIDEPVRAYRVGAAGQAPVVVAQREYATPLQPTIAVIPFTSRSNEPEHFAIGELIADGVIGQLSKASSVKVISRLSCTAFRGHNATLNVIGELLGSNYVLTGSYVASGDSLLVNAELSKDRTHEVVWSHRVKCRLSELFDADSTLLLDISLNVHKRMLNAEAATARLQPLPTLDSCTLMIGSITLMHRLSKVDFFRSKEMLEYLMMRHPRHVLPSIWLSKWYILIVAQGWSASPASDTKMALNLIQKALDADSNNALALTIKALSHGYLEKNFELARDTYADALTSNPNEPLAWIGQATLHSWLGDGESAVKDARRALSLSPLDPIKYYFDSLASTAMLSAGKYHNAIQLALSSIRQNREHPSTYKTLIEALYLTGDYQAAKHHAVTLMRLEPTFTVASFRQTSPLYRSDRGDQYARALADSGVPIN